MKIRDILDKSVDLLNKGAESVGKVAENVGKKIEDKKTSIDKFNYLASISNHLSGMAPYTEKNNYPSKSREQSILELGLTINVENAKLINRLLPIDETPINIKTAMETKTQIDYIFVITNKRLWILNKNEYKKYEFNEITKCEFVNRSLMTQGINFNNAAFSFDGNEQTITRFIELLLNGEKRLEEISLKTKYLCGITPKVQYTTIHYTGITIGTNNEIIIHESKDNSYIVNLQDIKYTQLLIDNTVVLTKGTTNTSIVGTLKPAKKISIKFQLDNGDYVVDIMKENIMNTIVKVEDSTYQEAYNLAKTIMTTLENMKNKVN